MMSKAFALSKQINEAKAQQREVNSEAMTYSDRVESKYEALAEIQSITMKVIQDVQQVVTRDRQQLQEAEQTVIDI